MNRFRARRKAKEQQQLTSHSDFDLPSSLSFGSKSFGKNKKPVPESRSVIDLTTALPSSNDFRTSLIMPNLSARFSMLREQDDPSTKIGKANDDSVLFPKRASRLNLFGHNPLTDIAEVSSIRESIRPPFASRESGHSIDGDGYDSDCGLGVMNRSRPGEGNNLFGGRQKLYKIPLDSSSKSPLSLDTSQPESGSMGGRVLYENDVSMSLFQKHREKEREERRKQLDRESLDGTDDGSQHSPVNSFSKDRGTTSSTKSAPKRISTAATSVDSQSPGQHNDGSASSLTSSTALPQPNPVIDRNPTVHRKLYGQGLYQSNSLQRVGKDIFDHHNRPRAASNDSKAHVDSPTKSNSKLSESSMRIEMSPPSLNFRSASPPPSASPSGTSGLDSTLRDAKSSEPAPGPGYGHSRPLSPPLSDGEDTTTFVNSVQPEDRGKATAMGLFNKPSRKYDDQQFSQRQLQMHQGRHSPAPRKTSPAPASTAPSPDNSIPVPGTQDISEDKSGTAKDARARAASLIRKQNEELAALEAQRTAGIQRPELAPPSSPTAAARNTFLLEEEDSPPRQDKTEPSVPAVQHAHETHPAFRPVVEGFQFPPFDATPTKVKSIDNHRPLSSASDDPGRNSPEDDDFTPRSEGLGLSGLIRTHLRHDSDKSSIYPPVSPRFTSDLASESPNPQASSTSTEDLDMSPPSQATNVQSRMAQNAKHFLTTATLLRNRSETETQPLAEEEARRSSQHAGQHSERSWQEELQSRHQRGGSSETQQEREAFNNELAERRRKVQEKLKNVVEGTSRSASPVLPSESSVGKPGVGFSAMLRSKPTRSKVANGQPSSSIPPEHPTKAMKLLGLSGPNTAKLGSPRTAQEELGKEEEERMLKDFRHRPRPKHTFGPSPTKNLSQPPLGRPSGNTSRNDHGERPQPRSVTPASIHTSARDRSASDVAGRSKSRSGQYRDDLDKAMGEGTSTHTRSHGASAASNVSKVPRPSMEAVDQPERSVSAMSGRYRSNSRTNTPGYFESKPLKPLQTSGISSTSASSRPSPRTPYSANSTPPILETSPVAFNPSTFTLPQPEDGRTTPGPSVRDRKRSITKNMISDPTFVSTTYSVSTVDLPPGASLRNGSPDIHQKDSSAPAIPFMNPSRRRGRIGTNNSTTHTLLSSLTGRSNDSKVDLAAAPHSAGFPVPEERSTFSDEGEDKKPSPLRPRHKLRKVSSEGGDMSAKARYQALMAAPSPALPTFPVKRGPSPTIQRIEGGMF